MNSHMAYFVFGVVIFASGIGSLFVFHLRRSREVSHSSWQALVAQLADVNRSGIEQIAQDLLAADGEMRADTCVKSMKPEEIWRLIGGIEGLEILERNSHVLIQMASYLREWHPDAEIAAEDLRLKAREIAYHVRQLRAAEHAGKLEGWFANYAQHAVAAYYLMTQRVLKLYQDGPGPMFAEVQRSI